MASNWGSPIQSANPNARMTAGQLFVNNAQQNANARIFGNPKVSNSAAQAANAIENGASVKNAKAAYSRNTMPNSPSLKPGNPTKKIGPNLKGSKSSVKIGKVKYSRIKK